MQILIVEDEQEMISVFREELALPTVHLTLAKSRESALDALKSDAFFDLIVCDLRIPTVDGALDADVDHGTAVIGHAQESRVGTPILAFTAYGSADVIKRLLRTADQQDAFGIDQSTPMLELLAKDELEECLARILTYAAAVGGLSSIEISKGVSPVMLTPPERRVLELYARRMGGGSVRLSVLPGGLSGNRILRLLIKAPDGSRRASVVAKVSPIAQVKAEEQQYHRHIAATLPNGLFTLLADAVVSGAANVGGLFYTVADDAKSLFQLLIDDPSKALLAAQSLQEGVLCWSESAPTDNSTIGAVRRHLLSDGQFRSVEQQFEKLRTIALDSLEASPLLVRACSQHNDLHGMNVLVGPNSEPVLIDFESVGNGIASIDPVTLELSLVFHPTMADARAGWPSPAQMARWCELHAYLEGCPWPEFVRSLREWAHAAAAGDREVYAVAYGYGLRQLKYEDTDKEVAIALVQAVADGLRS